MHDADLFVNYIYIKSNIARAVARFPVLMAINYSIVNLMGKLLSIYVFGNWTRLLLLNGIQYKIRLIVAATVTRSYDKSHSFSIGGRESPQSRDHFASHSRLLSMKKFFLSSVPVQCRTRTK